MRITVTARHLKLTAALHDYVQTKIEKLQRYSGNMISARVILAVEKYRQIVEINLHAGQRTFVAKEEGNNIYAAVDLAADTLYRQLEKYKGKKRRKFPSVRKRNRPEYAEPEYSGANLSSIHRIEPPRLTLEQALQDFAVSADNFFIFLENKSKQINVLVRDKDNNCELIQIKV